MIVKLQKYSFIVNFFLTLIETSIIILIWLIANFISKTFIPFIPAGILGMSIVLILLFCKVPIGFFIYGSNWLISEIILFFIPAVVSIIKYKKLFISQGISILIVIFISTLMVIICTSLVVEYFYFRRIKKNKN